MPGPRDTIGPPHAHRILDRRTALAQIGGVMALGCAAPSLAHPTGKKDHRMTWFALATRAGADGPRPVIQVGDAIIQTLLDAVRSDNNPQGFNIEKFAVIENKDIEVIER